MHRLQQEGEALARKNGELEATARRLRGQLKEAESDRERLQRRSAQQDELMTSDRDRLERKLEDSAQQVLLLRKSCSIITTFVAVSQTLTSSGLMR